MPRKRAGKAELKKVEIPIAWLVPSEAVSLPATNMVVQHDEHEFFLSFFEALPPLILGRGEEAQRRLAEVRQIEARFLTRVKVSAGRMQSFINVLQQNLDSYLKERAAAAEAATAATAAEN